MCILLDAFALRSATNTILKIKILTRFIKLRLVIHPPVTVPSALEISDFRSSHEGDETGATQVYGSTDGGGLVDNGGGMLETGTIREA